MRIKIQIQLNDGRKYDATLIGRDPQTDIALLQVKNAPKPDRHHPADSR